LTGCYWYLPACLLAAGRLLLDGRLQQGGGGGDGIYESEEGLPATQPSHVEIKKWLKKQTVGPKFYFLDVKYGILLELIFFFFSQYLFGSWKT
jgi:hypothetical protein